MNNNQKNFNNGQDSNIPLTPVFFAHWVGAPDNTKEALNQYGPLAKEKINLCLSTLDWKTGFSRS